MGQELRNPHVDFRFQGLNYATEQSSVFWWLNQCKARYMVSFLSLWSRALSNVSILLIICGNHTATAASLDLRGSYHWQSSKAEFGGLSGIAMSDEGSRITAISDRGAMFVGDVERQDGVITAVSVTGRHTLQDENGNPPALFLQNVEGLSVDPSGVIYVAYEGWARVWSYDHPDALPKWLHVWDRFWDLIGNSGFEALAQNDKGDLYVISEQVEQDAFPVFTYDGDVWSKGFPIPQADDFLISGADFGPDGELYLVERKFSWLRGFATRIRRIELGDRGIVKDTLLLDSPFGEMDNSEGIDIWQDATGTTIITLLSDDNFSPFQKTLITEFKLIE